MCSTCIPTGEGPSAVYRHGIVCPAAPPNHMFGTSVGPRPQVPQDAAPPLQECAVRGRAAVALGCAALAKCPQCHVRAVVGASGNAGPGSPYAGHAHGAAAATSATAQGASQAQEECVWPSAAPAALRSVAKLFLYSLCRFASCDYLPAFRLLPCGASAPDG